MVEDVLNLSSIFGLIAVIAFTLNFLLGMMLASAYKQSETWKKLPFLFKKISIIKIHNWTAYIVLLLVLIHPFILLINSKTHFNLINILIPAIAPKQPFMVSLGIIAFYAIIIVMVTSQKIIRKKLSFRSWKNIHLVSYLTVIFICIHGIMMDAELKNRPPDYFDGEKIISEVCLALILFLSILRLQFYIKKKVMRQKIKKS